MNILYLALQEIGRNTEGGKTHVYEVVKSFVNLGHHVHLVAFGVLDLERRDNLFVYNASIRKRKPVDFLNTYLLSYMFSAFKNKNRASYLSYLIKRIIVDKKIDLIYERHGDHDPGAVIGKEMGIKTILELNGINPLELKRRGYADDFINGRLAVELESIKKADKIVAVNAGIRDYYISAGIDERKISVVRNGVNLNIFQPRDKYACRKKMGFDRSGYYIGMVATFRFYQGIEYTIRIMSCIVKELREAKLVIVGHSDNNFKPSRSDLIDLAGSLGVSGNIILTGFRPYEEVPYYINSFDVCLLFRDYSEDGHWPVKLFEYMACGKPVVCTKWNSFKFIEEENLGFLVDHRDIKTTARRIVKLLKDERRCREMGERALNYAKKHCSWDKVATHILCQMER